MAIEEVDAGSELDERSIVDPAIEIRNAKVTYDEGESYVLDDVSIDLDRNEVLGVVGESGSGKSMFASSLLDSVPDPGVLTGRITYHPRDGEPIEVLDLSKEELRELRWEEISMVFQGAMSSFNPVLKVRTHFEETLEAHDANVAEGMDFARELLSDLYLDPDRVLDAYPHELSGGMTQRALIALSMVLNPEVLVMDEPTAALDLLMQRSILQLLEDLQAKYDISLVFITHDLPLIAALADRMAIMYAFRFVEVAPTQDLVANAAHPYTRMLLNSTPNLDAPLAEMKPIEGQSPAPINLPSGCAFHPRCPLAEEQCMQSEPDYHDVSDRQGARCFRWEAAQAQILLNYEDMLEDRGTSGGDADE
ncbi:ABC transporter ATP-binding protein [Halorhabdus amylolytica]|uniref:ABC transporter ATP-binding protein n=1 Tax=Halorhabdus amylolytica TaxID=2559573 RepID=UPI0010AA9BEA|nr:ABC transporter ATP-binding protein [Halorhabdus amylolytica]